MIIERKPFYDVIRPKLFPKGMSQGVVNGLEFLLSTWERQYQERTPITQFANVLGTAFLETAATMNPIHEYGDRAYFMRMYDKTGSRPGVAATLGNTEVGDGAKFAGMGYVQSTGRANARRNTQKLRALGIIGPDIDFEANHELMMKPEYAVHIMFIGMKDGWFTGKKLDDLIDANIDGDEHADFIKARAIINGKDRAEDIANYSDTFLAALRVAQRAGDVAPAKPADAPKAPGPQPSKPKPPAAPAPPAAPEPTVPTPANPEPKGWFEHLLDVLRSGRK